MSGFSLLTRLSPHQILFWSGAGISADGPTSGPLGRNLTDRALDNYFEPGLADDLQNIYQAIGAPDAEVRPRLETVLDSLVAAYGLDGLADALSDLSTAAPNDVHSFFAAHIDRAGFHITANFDTCIERAAPGDRRPLHFHGKLGTDTDLRELGARVSVIENGFPESLEENLDEILSNDELKALAFVGYSGSDFFDASPYLASRWELLKGKTVVWHEYGGVEKTLAGSECDEHPHLRAARAAGAQVFLVRGLLRESLNELANAWGMRRLPPAPSRNPTWHRSLSPSAGQKREATLSLASQMGLRGLIIRLVESKGGELTHSETGQYADALWGAGRYRDALRAWGSVYSDETATSRALLTERQGAVMWIRGQYVRAERRLRRALVRWVSPGSPIPASIQILLVEAYGRVLVHMRRSPDTRMLVRTDQVERALEEAERLRKLLSNKEGIHIRARVQSLVADLSDKDDQQADAHIEEFSQSESLHGWLNYRHHRIRQQAANGILPSKAELCSLISAQQILGAHGDAARVLLLPGAEYAFPPLAAWRAFQGLDITLWHRIRIASRHALLVTFLRLQRKEYRRI